MLNKPLLAILKAILVIYTASAGWFTKNTHVLQGSQEVRLAFQFTREIYLFVLDIDF